jgi:hypothetical protein
MRSLDLLEKVMIVALSVALACSLVISYHVYFRNDASYSQSFSAWQMPMIVAILGELYFMKKYF